MHTLFRAMPAADPAHYVRGQYDGYRDIDGVAADSTHRDLRRAAPGDRQLALVGRAVLHPHRQAAAGHADRAAARLRPAAAAGLPRRHAPRRPSRCQLVVKLDPTTGVRLLRRGPARTRRSSPSRSASTWSSPTRAARGRRPTRCCCSRRCTATPRASPARTASRRPGASWRRCSTRRRRCTRTRRARGARRRPTRLLAGHGRWHDAVGGVMSDYDVIVIGSGAGGGTLVRRLAPSGKRILLLERGDWLPREPQNWRPRDVFVDNRYVSPGHLVRRATTSRSSRRCTTASAAPRSSTARRCTACARRTSASCATTTASRRRGRSSYDELEPYYTRAEQLYQVHGARGEDPDRAAGQRALPVPGRRATSRASSSSPTTSRRPGTTRSTRPCGVHARRGRHARTARACAARPATASRAWCTRSPTPRCSACARRSSTPTSRC